MLQISNPRKLLSPPLGASIYAVACLMAYDGLTGISLPMASPVDILTSLMNAPAVQATNMSRFAEKKKKDHAPRTPEVQATNMSKSKEKKKKDHAPRTPEVQATNMSKSTEKKKKDHAPRTCKYFLRSMVSQSSTHAQVEHAMRGKILPPAQTKPGLVQPPKTSAQQEGPMSLPSVPVKPTLKERERKRKNKPKKQPSGAILPPVQRKQVLEQPHATTGVMLPPSVQATLKKRKRKNKSRTNEREYAGAVLPPVHPTSMVVERPVRTTAQEKPVSGPLNSPSAPMQARPTANQGLGVLAGYGSNQYGPYGPRGK